MAAHTGLVVRALDYLTVDHRIKPVSVLVNIIKFIGLIGARPGPLGAVLEHQVISYMVSMLSNDDVSLRHAVICALNLLGM